MQETIAQYTQDAIRTESVIDKVELNSQFLKSVVAMSIASGQMLDQIKKHAFYGKEYNEDAFKTNFAHLVSALEAFKGSFDDMNDEEELDIDPRVFHAITGIATESTELLEALNFDGEEIDRVNLLEESFDVDWYQFILMDALNGNLQDVWDTGIAKLKARYPDAFTSDDAINRDLDAEREILDNLDDTKG